MGLLKLLIIGTAAAAGYNYMTKKRADGTSMVDDIKTKAPEWMEKAKPYMDKAKPFIDKLKTQSPSATSSGDMGFNNVNN